MAAVWLGLYALAMGAMCSELALAEGEQCFHYNTNPVCTDVTAVGDDWAGSWYWRGNACGRITTRSFNADGTKRQSYIVHDASNMGHATVPGCIFAGGDWWQGVGYGLPDSDGAYYVIRLQIRAAVTGLVYDVYASSDGAHSTAAAWTGGAGNFERWCLDPTVSLFPEAC